MTMTELLVEFPSREVAAAAAPPPTSSCAAKPPPRLVRFAPMTTLILTPYVSREELATQWYTKPERDRQKAKLKDDVRRLSRTFALTPMDSIGEQRLYECVGMEVRVRPPSLVVVCSDKCQRRRSHLTSSPRAASRTDVRRSQAFLSRDVLLQTKRHKVAHGRAILVAQARQRTSAVRDEEQLAQLSRRSSDRARVRAQKIAAGYWKVLKP